jgi:hypothetical protein
MIEAASDALACSTDTPKIHTINDEYGNEWIKYYICAELFVTS